ncbi:TPA: hypothetical protein ONA41_006491 [Pseudomonas aeruginosa]|nr:hypothetical protein [Enterobacter mori]HCB1755649.1 hypothetical protein [Klebsiella oxytoca]HCR1321529.1 hypothetical protein [Pseudomonas aeruginosa]EKX7630398.1 hypothetical protein [Enterobacter mori]HCB1755875.1 hypothetical protein [Klebsiella oxytoca]
MQSSSENDNVIALELATGELYRTRAPATTLRLRR